MNETRPPYWITYLIQNLAQDRVAEEIEGDLNEMYYTESESYGQAFARRKYIQRGLGFLAKRFFWKQSAQQNHTIMLQSYFKMAQRSLMAYKSTSVINIAGHVLGLASALVIFTFIRFELSFDSFHSDRDQIYRVVRVSGPDMSEFRTGVSYPVPAALKAEIPSIKNIASYEYFGGANVVIPDSAGNDNLKFREEHGFVLVEPSFFKVFDFKGSEFKWISGSPEVSLKEPFSVVLTKTMSKKYFGDEDPIGRTIELQRTSCKVTGLTEDFPNNTDFPFSVMISYETLRKLSGEDRINNWFSVNDTHQTYITLHDASAKKEMEEKIAKVHAAHTPKELSDNRHYLLQKLSDVHFDAKFGTLRHKTISKDTVFGLSIIAIFLVITAAINYVNLSTAQSTLRAREIGVRKVMGSTVKNVVAQHLIETFILVLFACVLGLIASDLLHYYLQSVIGMEKTTLNVTDPFMLLVVLIAVILITTFSGLYPALVLSRFNPASVLKNKFGTDKVGGFSLRKVLVVVQFTITQILVVGTFIVISQMNYFRNADMGFVKQGIVNLRIPKRDRGAMQVLEDQLLAKSFVEKISLSSTFPSGTERNRSYADIGRPEANAMQDYIVYEYVAVDENYLDLFKIKLVAGRSLKQADSTGNILVNKSVVKNLRLESPEQALGQELKLGGGDKVVVVGVIEDYYSNSLKEAPDNIVMMMQPQNYVALSIKLTGKNGHLPDQVEEIKKTWAGIYPEFIPNPVFFDENIAAFYQQEEKYSTLFKIFSIIFILIGSLGLYGLVTFVVNRKQKEVAIRKVMGASVRHILVLFSKEYLMLITLSFVLAVPVAYYGVTNWLSNFQNHIPLQWYLFVTPGILVLVIALVVIMIKASRAAVANPVDKLKYE
jgi:putative ABC transport system permease protein